MLSKFNWDFPFSCGRTGMAIFVTTLKPCSIEFQKYRDGISFLHSLLLLKTQVQNRACAQQMCDETGISQNTLVFTCKLYNPYFIVSH